MSKVDSTPRKAAGGPASARPCIVMTCDDRSEAEQVGRQLRDLDAGLLVTYERAEDFIHNAPASRVAMVILAARTRPASVRRALRWVRRHWPRCPVAVVGDEGCGDEEMAAREGGATYLLRSAARSHWHDLLQDVLGTARRGPRESRR